MCLVIRLREFIQRRGRSLIALASLCFISLILAWAHSAPASGHMGEDGMQDSQMVLMCMAVLAAGAALTAAVTGILSAPLPRPPRELGSRGLKPVAARALSSVDPRAGPATLQVFRC